MAFKVICAGHTPGHVTVPEFRKAFPGAMGEFFAQVLALCARLGMGRPGVVALDGMKIAASAPEPANRTEGKLRELAAATVARHGQADQAEDALFGAGGRAAMRCPGLAGRRVAAPSGSPPRWPACKPGAPPRRRSGRR